MAPPVHQLRSSLTENGKRILTARCGANFTVKAGCGSDSITAWGSQVTCPECLGHINEDRRQRVEKFVIEESN